jgi:hypothetical protein
MHSTKNNQKSRITSNRETLRGTKFGVRKVESQGHPRPALGLSSLRVCVMQA